MNGLEVVNNKEVNMEDSLSSSQLKQFIERIENLEEEKAATLEGIKAIFDEAKNGGFDKKVMREILKIRKKSRDEQEEFDEMVGLYREILGV